MFTKKILFMLMGVLVIIALLTGCSSGDTGSESDKPYIPVISKGFQHQFWQAVKTGSEQAAAEFNVEITFEGPESEAMVDKQVEMFQTAERPEPLKQRRCK